MAEAKGIVSVQIFERWSCDVCNSSSRLGSAFIIMGCSLGKGSVFFVMPLICKGEQKIKSMLNTSHIQKQ